MSKCGRCGTKSLPTSIHMNTKSSTTRCASYLNPSGPVVIPLTPPVLLAPAVFIPDDGPPEFFCACGLNSKYNMSRNNEISNNSNSFPSSARSDSYFGTAFFLLRHFIFSRSNVKCGSCATNPNIIRSASNPYMQCLTLGVQSDDDLHALTQSIILCSPSPGLSGPENTTLHPCCQHGSVLILCFIHALNLLLSSNINSVPGVIQFESKCSPSGISSCLALASANARSDSCADRYLLDLC
mmetsp:Transcript_11284/g.20393  ORF Transcript_11284/g.20393 Transcript_11284/m.20393 type:complete len:240 (-) Transcript_11284:369-1088(-)